MLRNYLKTALRNLWRNKVYTALNVSGLALGIATLLTVTLFVSHELSYDRFNKKADRIVGTVGTFSFGEMTIKSNRLSAAYTSFLRNNFSEIEQTVRIGDYPNGEVFVSTSASKMKSKEPNLALTENAIFDIFTFDILEGNPVTALTNPMTVAISKSTAQKYFGQESALGQLLKVDDKFLATVTCVYQDFPTNSSLQYNMLLSLSSLNELEEHYWEPTTFSLDNTLIQIGTFQTYVLLKNPAAIAAIQQKIPEALAAAGVESKTISPDSYTFYPLTDLHLANLGLNDGKLRKYIIIFSVIGLIVIALALINFINISTSLSFQRAKEVGERKTIGANKSQISKQFFLEYALVTTLAFVTGFGLFNFFRSNFYDLLGVNLSTDFVASAPFLFLLFSIYVFCVFSTSIYSSAFLSQFNPVKVLKSNLNVRVSGINIRKVLIVGQFTLSIALLISTFVIYQQFKFMLNFDVGLAKNNTLVVPLSAQKNGQLLAIKSELQHTGNFQEIGISNFNFFKTYSGRYFTKSPVNKEEVSLATMSVNESFFDMMGLEWKQEPADKLSLLTPNEVIINETAMKAYGFKSDDFLGQRIEMGSFSKEVVGVFKDFHFIGPQAPIEPVLISFLPENETLPIEIPVFLYLKLSGKSSTQSQITAVESVYKKLLPDETFEFHFLDDAYQAQYLSEKRLMTFVSFFSGLAIIISCLGLFGLARLSIKQKTKEIGVRKVLGAGIMDLSKMLTLDFIKLVAVAGVIAVPIAYYFMTYWLQDFTLRVNLQWLYFAIPCVISVVLSMLTIGFQSVKAALSNPVKSLRSE
jgi:putative ABC transport system permease protein